MAGKRRELVDILLEAWARERRELLGLRHPLSAREYIGPLRCTLSARRDLHAGARSEGRRVEHWPEFPYTGDLALVNLVVKATPEPLRSIYDWHWTLERPKDKRQRAELVGLSSTVYWHRVGFCRERVLGALAVLDSVRTHAGSEGAISATMQNSR